MRHTLFSFPSRFPSNAVKRTGRRFLKSALRYARGARESLNAESLEPRTLLAVTATLVGHDLQILLVRRMIRRFFRVMARIMPLPERALEARTS